MMGRLKSDQGQLFYEFHLNDAIPEDHLVRKIDAALDLSWLRSELAPHYSSMGRPSVDPELMIRMLVVGYVFAIRSERLICREVQVNLAYRWFCKLGIEDAIPDHSAFSRARNERFREGDVFRRVFERVVEACIAAGLVGGEGFAVDASLIQADANKQRSIAGEDWRNDRDPARSSRAVKEYLATLDDTSWGAASDVVPKFVSPSDPAAQWTGAHKGPAFFAYANNYLIDVKYGVIVDVEASRAIRQAEVGAAKTMIDRTEERFGLKPERLAADTAYGAAPMLNWLVEEKAIAPHIPVFDKSKRDDGTFARSDFRYDPTSDIYHCPAGKTLTTTGTLVNGGTTLLYLARKHDCDGCKLRAQCCPKVPFRKIPRDQHEAARDIARSFVGTKAFEQSRRERKKIEMRFAHLKRILRSTAIARPERRPGRVYSGRHRSEPAAARSTGSPTATYRGSVHCVALELRRERQGRRIKAGCSKRNGRPSSQPTDFCNTICQKRKQRPALYSTIRRQFKKLTLRSSRLPVLRGEQLLPRQ